MLDGDAGDDADVGARNLRQTREFAAMRHAHFEHDRFVVVFQLQQGQWQSVFVIQISLSLQNAQPRAHKRRKDFLGGRFTHRASHGANAAAWFSRAPNFAGARRQSVECGERIVDGESATLNFGRQTHNIFREPQ